jgi:hypothetical protein
MILQGSSVAIRRVALAFVCAWVSFIAHASPGRRPAPGVLLTFSSTSSTAARIAHPPLASPNERAREDAQPALSRRYGRFPLSFERNEGQAAPGVSFVAHGRGFSASLRGDGVSLGFTSRGARPAGSVGSETLHLRFAGARKGLRVEGSELLPGKVNYFVGSNPARWKSNLPTFRRVEIPGVYPGIDVVFYGNQRDLEYDFLVAPGADASRIELAFSGARDLSVGAEGELVIDLANGRMVQRPPLVFERRGGERRPVECHYRLLGEGRVGLRLGRYDAASELLIDPVLGYSTYFGGSSGDESGAVAVDATGAAYFTGSTHSAGFPVSAAAWSTTLGGKGDVFVTKLDPTGTSPVYSTYLGGSGSERATAIAVDAGGNAYVTGGTLSNDFPTQAAFDGTYGGAGFFDLGDAFLTKLGPTGATLAYSTYLGGSKDEVANAIALEASGSVVVVGQTASSDFPTKNALQPAIATPAALDGLAWDAFVLRMSPAGSALASSTFFGGTGDDLAHAVAAGAGGSLYVGGRSFSADFPATSPFGKGSAEGFVTKLSAAGAIAYSIPIGGSQDDAVLALALDAKGSVYAVGETRSEDFPVKAGAFQKHFGGSPGACANPTGCPDAFLTKVAPDGASFELSTFLGGLQADRATSIALSSDGFIHVAGETDSVDLPIANGVQNLYGGGAKAGFGVDISADGFVARFAPNGQRASLSYLGGAARDAIAGIAADPDGNVVVVGTTESKDFPTASPYQDSLSGSDEDAFVAKIAYSTTPGGGGPVVPSSGGDIGPLTISVFGQGFAQDATFRLTKTGSEDRKPARTAVPGDGGAVVGTIDLTGAALGDWDVIVSTGGADLVYPAAFAVEVGRAPDLWVELAGRAKARTGTETTLTMLYGNNGNVDALAIPLLITGIPKDAEVRLDEELLPVTQPPNADSMAAAALGPIQVTETDKRVAILAPSIGAGTTGSVRVHIRFPKDGDVTISGWIGRSLLEEPSAGIQPMSGGGNDKLICLWSIAGELANFIPSAACGKAAAKWLLTTVLADTPLLVLTGSYDNVPKMPLAQILYGFMYTIAECAGAPAHIVAEILHAAEIIVGAAEVSHSCEPLLDALAEWLVNLAGSHDPNDKAGVSGGGPERAVRGDVALAYAIFFENDKAATAAAQKVVITDVLPADLDLASVAFGRIAVADRILDPPPGAQQHTGYLDLRASQGLLVRVEASLDVPKRTLSWKLTALDADTGLPPDDPLAGFLPPNVTSPEGEGSVSLLVTPKKDSPSGTRIENMASIVFDANPAIETPVWSNLIDRVRPTSSMVARAASATPAFEVGWKGSDDGAGIAYYDVYASIDGGELSVWQERTRETHATYSGKEGTTYRFAVMSVDFAGNKESKPLTPELTVAVEAGSAAEPDACGCRAVGAPATDALASMLLGLASAGVTLSSRRRRRRG